MKTIRRSMILVGFSVALFGLAATVASAQALSTTSFAGKFTLPVETHWGAMTLPAGDYSLRYGTTFSSTYLVTVADEAEGRILGMILPGSRNDVKVAENVLDCVREGDTLFVRALELPAIGESIHFKIPHVVAVRSRVIAGHQNEKGFTRVASVAVRIEPVPVH